MIECNYIADFVEDDAVNKCHIFRGHAELKTSLGVIEANKTDNLKNVIFCHLSKVNCDEGYQVIEEAKKFVLAL